MVDIYKAYENNTDLEKSGVKLQLGEKSYILVARAGGSNTTYLETYNELTKPYRQILDKLQPEQSRAINAKIYAKSIVKGWENIVGRDGEILEFSEENVVKILTDLPDLFRTIQELALSQELFRASTAEEDAGNSQSG